MRLPKQAKVLLLFSVLILAALAAGACGSLQAQPAALSSEETVNVAENIA